MGFDVWVARPPAPAGDRLLVGPGQGSTLLVCASPEQSAGRLAGDIARAVGGDPVWAWPDPEGRQESPRLEEAVRDGLFTRVVVFGKDAARQLLGRETPAVLVSARVALAADIDELAIRGTAKQELWSILSRDSGGT